MVLSSLIKRTISAILLLPIVLAAIFIGGNLFFIVVALVLGLATFEFILLMEKDDQHPNLIFSWGFVGIGLFIARDPNEAWFRPTMTGLLGGALVWQLFQTQRPTPTSDWALTVVGGLYVGWMGGHLVALRQVPDGTQWLLLCLIITWVGDTGAYFVGSALGRHKLAPRLSPGKTIEGTAAGWVTGVVTGGFVAGLLGMGISHGIALGSLIGVGSLLGDLGISMIKRQVGVKDSSRLIPGHGGMLDRIDSILFTVTVGYYYVRWVIL